MHFVFHSCRILIERRKNYLVFFFFRWAWVAVSGITLGDDSSLWGYEIKVSKFIFFRTLGCCLFYILQKCKIKFFNIFLCQAHKRRCCGFIVDCGVFGFPALLKNKLTTIIWPRFNCCYLSCHLYHCCVFVTSGLSWIWKDTPYCVVNKNNPC